MTDRPSLASVGDRIVVLAASDGRPLVRLKALHAAAIAAASVLLAPRATAAAAIGALFGGYSLRLSENEPADG